MEYESLKRKALKRVKAKKGFYIHLSIYFAMALFFFVMNVATFKEDNEWWFFFPLIPWGSAILIHYLVIFGIPGTDIMSSKWERREYEKELEKLEWHEYQKAKGYQPRKSRATQNEDFLDLEEMERKEAKILEKPSWDDKEFV